MKLKIGNEVAEGFLNENDLEDVLIDNETIWLRLENGVDIAVTYEKLELVNR